MNIDIEATSTGAYAIDAIVSGKSLLAMMILTLSPPEDVVEAFLPGAIVNDKENQSENIAENIADSRAKIPKTGSSRVVAPIQGSQSVSTSNRVRKIEIAPTLVVESTRRVNPVTSGTTSASARTRSVAPSLASANTTAPTVTIGTTSTSARTRSVAPSQPSTAPISHTGERARVRALTRPVAASTNRTVVPPLPTTRSVRAPSQPSTTSATAPTLHTSLRARPTSGTVPFITAVAPSSRTRNPVVGAIAENRRMVAPETVPQRRWGR